MFAEENHHRKVDGTKEVFAGVDYDSPSEE